MATRLTVEQSKRKVFCYKTENPIIIQVSKSWQPIDLWFRSHVTLPSVPTWPKRIKILTTSSLLLTQRRKSFWMTQEWTQFCRATLLIFGFATQWRCGKMVLSWMMRNSLIILRIYNRPIGKRCDSNHPHPIVRSAGVLNSDRWKSSSPNLRTQPIRFSLYWSLVYCWGDFWTFESDIRQKLLSKWFFSYNLNLTVPISLVEENMKRAEKRDAVNTQKFYFRYAFWYRLSPTCMFRINPDEDEPVVKELTIDQIINGGSGFPGLVPFMERFLQDTATEIEISCQIKVF